MGPDGGWTLAVAQRSFEWDENRISNLVDSLYEGFPIGSLLVVKGAGRGYAMTGDTQGGRPTVDGEIQILDGQQRCLAMQAAFTHRGLGTGLESDIRHLWIHLGDENTNRRAFHPQRGRRLLLHWTSKEQLNGLDQKERRIEQLPAYTPLTGWERFSTLVQNHTQSAEFIAGNAGIHDPCEKTLSFIQHLCQRIQSLWNDPFVPVHFWIPQSGSAQMERLHHAFVRLNTGGVPLRGEDQFLAGVKLYWPDAESRLAKITACSSSLLDHRAGVELVSRVALRLLDSKDSSPLKLADLAEHDGGDGTNKCVEQMQALTNDSPEAQRLQSAIQTVCELLIQHLHAGASQIGRPQLLAAITWVFRKTAHSPPPTPAELKSLLGFLFWSTAFRSHTYSTASFSRKLLHSAWNQGGKNPPHPLARDTPFFNHLCYGNSYVKDLFWDDDGLIDATKKFPGKKTKLIRKNRTLFLSLFQSIPDTSTVEWDHIFPFSKAKRRFRIQRSPVWEYSTWINQTGNFAGIAMRANRVLGNRDLATKLGWDGVDSSETYLNLAFVAHDPNITELEIGLLRSVEENPKDMDTSGKAFRDFVLTRTKRIWETAVSTAGPPPSRPVDDQTRNS
jgi:hypothetical protein